MGFVIATMHPYKLLALGYCAGVLVTLACMTWAHRRDRRRIGRGQLVQQFKRGRRG